jgi:hypothetical protein
MQQAMLRACGTNEQNKQTSYKQIALLYVQKKSINVVQSSGKKTLLADKPEVALS